MIPTAEEFISNHYGAIWDKRPENFKEFISRDKFIKLHAFGMIDGVEKSNKDLLIEFAQMHCQAMVDAIYGKDISGLVTWYGNPYSPENGSDCLDKEKILKAYPLENIK